MLEWITRGFFVLNAVLYGALAIRTSLDPDGTAQSAGLSIGSAPTRSEYLVSHGGLLVSLAAIFALFALTSDNQVTGLKAAIAFYIPILVYRTVPALMAANRFKLSLGAVGLEAAMLLAAIGLLVLTPAK